MSGLANNEGESDKNALSFSAVDQSMWLGNGPMINQWRREVLHLRPIRSGTFAGTLLSRLQVPFSYMWSPSFVPKPEDWPAYTRVVGAFTADQVKTGFDESAFADVIAWLKAGSPPIFVGFGSMVIQDPKALAAIIMEAAEASGQRVIVQSNWSKIEVGASKNCFDVGPCPHDWLLPQVAAVVHHGGAGTTAAGLRYAKPTLVCPFFGDQPFWGEMVRRAGAGPPPCPIGKLDAASLTAKFSELCSEEMRGHAAQLASTMEAEDGIAEGFAHLLGELPRESLLCDACLLLTPPELCVATFNLCHTRHVVVQLTMMAAGLVLGLLAGPSLFYLNADHFAPGTPGSGVKSSVTGEQATDSQLRAGVAFASIVFGLMVMLIFLYVTQLVRLELWPEHSDLKVSSEVVGLCVARRGSGRAGWRRLLPELMRFWDDQLPAYYAAMHAGRRWDTSHVASFKTGVLAGVIGFLGELVWGILGLLVIPDRLAREHGFLGFCAGVVWSLLALCTVRPTQAVLILFDRMLTGACNAVAYQRHWWRPRAYMIDPTHFAGFGGAGGWYKAILEPRLKEVRTHGEAPSEERVEKLRHAVQLATAARREFNRCSAGSGKTGVMRLCERLGGGAAHRRLGLNEEQAAALVKELKNLYSSDFSYLLSFTTFCTMFQEQRTTATGSSRAKSQRSLCSLAERARHLAVLLRTGKARRHRPRPRQPPARHPTLVHPGSPPASTRPPTWRVCSRATRTCALLLLLPSPTRARARTPRSPCSQAGKDPKPSVAVEEEESPYVSRPSRYELAGGSAQASTRLDAP